jgi:pimeloyl-ACP methyl ester carboxylesterase
MPKTFINGIDLYYKIHGSGPPILLLHGLGLDHTFWDPQVEEFSRTHQVIVHDLRGHGRSESPDVPYSIDQFSDDLDQFLHFLGLKQAILLGLSLGGRILIRFALKFPQEVRALILADAQSETPPEAGQRFKALAEVARKEGMTKAAEVFFSWPALELLARRHSALYQREKSRFVGSSPVGLANSCLAIAGMEPLTEQLERIQAETLAVAGEEDEPYLPYLDLYARKIPNCLKRTIPGAGHLSSLENPRAFNETVLSFLKGIGEA